MRILILLVFLNFVNTPAIADLRSLYGASPVSASLGGADQAKSYNATTFVQNPSLLSQSDKTSVTFGMFGASDFFSDIDNVVVDNYFLGGTTVGQTRSGNIDTDVPDTFLAQFALILPLGQTPKRWRLGLALNSPVDKMAGSITKDVYTPHFSLYQSSTQRFTLVTGISFQPWESFYLGVSGHLYFVTGATMESRLRGTPQTSSGTNATDIRPGLAPSLGITWKEKDAADSVALVFLAERNSRTNYNINTSITLMGPVPLALHGDYSQYYDPETLSLGYAHEFEHSDLLIAVDWERWERFDGQHVKMSFDTWQPQFNQTVENTQYKNILVPRVGVSFQINDLEKIRVGYFFKPSPTPDLSGAINLVDSDRHSLSVGYGRVLNSVFGLIDGPFQLDTHIQGQYLVPKHVTKSDATYIGAPGYDIKGMLISYGVSLSTEL